MRVTVAVVLIFALTAFSACNKSKSPDQPQNAATSSSKSDAVQQKLQEIAGSGATDCGNPKSQQPADVEPASKCAMQAAQNKQAFYVRYDLPGMTTAMAGDAQGKLYAVQSEANGQVQSTPCPAEIRQAQSGRVTCYAAGSMGSMSGADPHGGGMMTPPAIGPNPHDGSAMPSHGSSKPRKPKP